MIEPVSQVLDAPQRELRGRKPQPLRGREIFLVAQNVRVAVDETRQHDVAPQVDDSRPRRLFERTDRFDAIAGDDDRLVVRVRSGRDIEKTAGANDQPLLGGKCGTGDEDERYKNFSHAQGYRAFEAAFACTFLRCSDGDVPNRLRKERMKWLRFEKPTS